MITEKDLYVCNCLLGNKWNFLIIKSLLEGEKRFSALKREIHTISDRVLCEKIKVLITYEIVEKGTNNFYNKVYQLTEKGKALKNFVEAFDKWTASYYPEK